MEKKGVGRPRDGNPEETRQGILRAAAEAFAEAGFVGATTRLVAARAGVNVATLHYHFGSKAGLYWAVLASVARGPLPVLPNGPGAETVARLVDVLFAWGAERPTLARLSLLDALAGPVREGAAAPGERVRWVAEALRPHLGPVNGQPPPCAEDAARAIVMLLDAALVAGVPRRPEGRSGAVEGRETVAPPPLPPETARSAVLAAALRITGLG